MKKTLIFPVPALAAPFKNDLRSFILRLPPDYFRSLPFRFLGYGFAVGHALNYQNWCKESEPFYIMGWTYFIGHSLYKFYQVMGPFLEDELGVVPRPESRYCNVVLYDTLIWDFLASFLAPTAIAYWLCWATDCILNVFMEEDRDSMIRKWLPLLVSLVTLPLLSHQIDSTVDLFMTSIIRPLYENYENIVYSMVHGSH
ncbi:mitochondrial fission process protein 1 [Biomphalaria glabrata]|uniref:Mitochondrial fission process protein 1 n=1 Tax=Biomphalaria glabrata TaxID=6526 RepID=A0A2C9JQW2_BIOGL|nr:mitochondrial fission process protein 1 [Biomphalaria glabrata]